MAQSRPHVIVLDDGHARAEVHPNLGAALGRYDVIVGDGRTLPIFQTSASAQRLGPFALGLNLLIPFSNRISGGGFRHDGTFHALERNAADPYPIHGNALWLPWIVRAAAENSVSLGLTSNGPGPFRYVAEVDYTLEAGALSVRLAVTNRGASSLPFGAGFHPWFVRSPEARLTMSAAGYWTETADHLPDEHRPTAGDSRFDFSRGRPLPQTFFNNAFTGWDGRATLEWPDRRLAVDMVATPPLTTAILYSPSAAADYVCIEPVSHSVDAHNRSGDGVAPPQVLSPAETLAVEVTMSPHELT
jgi:aldose 1-epimerase